MTNQGDKQASFRLVGGTTGTYEEDVIAALGLLGYSGTYNERLYAWLADRTGETGTLSELMYAFAVANGAPCWNGLGTMDVLPKQSDLMVWLDATDVSTITKNGSNVVSEWRDKSGNGNHAGSAIGSPTWASDALGGSYAGIQFGSDGLVISDSASLDYDEITIFVVSQRDTDAGGGDYTLWKWGGTAPDQEFLIQAYNAGTPDTVRAYTGNGTSSAYSESDLPSVTLETPFITEYAHDGINAYLRTNNDNHSYQGKGITNGSADLKIGHAAVSDQQTISEILIWNKYLSPYEKGLVYQYLNTKYGITYTAFDTKEAFLLFGQSNANGTGLVSEQPSYLDAALSNIKIYAPAEVTLGTDPLATSAASTTITVTHSSHGKSAGDRVRIYPGADIDGIPQNEFKSSKAISNVTTNTYDVTVTTAASAGGSFGGSSVKIAYEGGTWASLESGVNNRLLAGSNFGAEMSFAYFFDQYGDQDDKYLIKYAVDGNGFSDDDLLNSFYPDSGQNYAGMQRDIELGVAAIRASGVDIAFSGILHIAGERESTTSALANATEAALVYLHNTLKTWLSSRGMFYSAPKIVISQVGQIAAGGWPYSATVRAAQVSAAAALSNATTIDTSEFEVSTSDNVHYTADGCVDLGEAFAGEFTTVSMPYSMGDFKAVDLDASDESNVTKTGSTVTGMTNNGSGNNATVLNSPQYSATAINGSMPGISMATSGLVIADSAALDYSEYTLFWVGQRDTKPSSDYIFWKFTNSGQYEFVYSFYHTTADVRSWVSFDRVNAQFNLNITGSITDGEALLIDSVYDGSDYTLRVSDPEEELSATCGALTNGTDDIKIGHAATGAEQTFGEILWYTARLTEIQRAKMRTYLTDKWGL